MHDDATIELRTSKLHILLLYVTHLEGLLDLDSNVFNPQQQEGHNTADKWCKPLANRPKAQRNQAQPNHQKLRCVPVCDMQLLHTNRQSQACWQHDALR